MWHCNVLTRFGFTVWEAQLKDRVLWTLDAEQRPSGHFGSRLKKCFIPNQSFVRDLPLVIYVKYQPSQRTLEYTRALEHEPVQDQMVLRKLLITFGNLPFESLKTQPHCHIWSNREKIVWASFGIFISNRTQPNIHDRVGTTFPVNGEKLEWRTVGFSYL